DDKEFLDRWQVGEDGFRERIKLASALAPDFDTVPPRATFPRTAELTPATFQASRYEDWKSRLASNSVRGSSCLWVPGLGTGGNLRAVRCLKSWPTSRGSQAMRKLSKRQLHSAARCVLSVALWKSWKPTWPA